MPLAPSTCRAARLLTAALTLTTGCATSRTLPSDPQQRTIAWSDDWRRVGALEYAVTLGTGTVAAWAELGVERPEISWRGGWLFDDWIQDRVGRWNHEGFWSTANRISDIGFVGLTLYPLVVDPIFVTLLGHGEKDVAWQQWVISAQSIALSGLVATATHAFIGRERPYMRHCEDPEWTFDPGCDDWDVGASFIAGHTAMAMAGAGLICAHHEHLPLYGGGWGDALACGIALTYATAGGVLRIMTDKHYTSDTVVAWVVGLAAGYLLPTLVYYKGKPHEPRPSLGASAAETTTTLPLVFGVF